MTILDFLKARIAEDEAVAQVARPSEHLHTRDNGSLAVVEDDGYSTCSITSGRVLRQVATNRAIVWLHGRLWNDSPHIDNDALICREDRDEFPCETLCHLASVYADHQDYREEWKR